MQLTNAGSKHYNYLASLGSCGASSTWESEISFVSDRLTTVTYLIRRGDDVHTDNLFSQDRFRMDAVESSSKFCVLGQGLDDEKFGLFFQISHENVSCTQFYFSGWKK